MSFELEPMMGLTLNNMAVMEGKHKVLLWVQMYWLWMHRFSLAAAMSAVMEELTAQTLCSYYNMMWECEAVQINVNKYNVRVKWPTCRPVISMTIASVVESMRYGYYNVTSVSIIHSAQMMR